MAGSSADFDADDFRETIAATMTMGLPDDEALRPTFHFAANPTYEKADRTGKPWSWTDTPDDPGTPPDPVRIPCAVEVDTGATTYTGLGTFNAARAVLTILDEHWSSVVGFDHVTLGGNVYTFDMELPPVGLFDVTVHQVRVVARDEA